MFLIWKYIGKENLPIEKLPEYKKVYSEMSSEDILKLEYKPPFAKEEFKGWTNRESILRKYTKEELKETGGEPKFVKPETFLCYDDGKIAVNLASIPNANLFLEQKGFDAFWSENYKKLIENDGYVPAETVPQGEGIKYRNLNVRIWIYSRALEKILDVSPFVINCSTSKTKEMGSFSIMLPPILSNEAFEGTKYDYTHIFNTEDYDGNLNWDFFEKNIQYNDIVFLRFEKLKLENELENTYSGNLIIPNSRLGNQSEDIPEENSEGEFKVWDMIGLVDSVISSYSSEYDKLLTISLRDLTKLIVEDGSYFIPLKNTEGSQDNWFYGGDKTSQWFKRNVVSGNYDNIFSWDFRRINETFAFVISQLANLGIVSNNLFSSYGDRTTDSISMNDKGLFELSDRNNGIWKIVKVFIEKALEKRALVDTSFANPDGTIQDLMQRLCQYPFVEFWGDTYIDTFDFIVRQPPFSMESITQVKDEHLYVEIEKDDLLSVSLSYDNTYYSWYQVYPQNAFIANSGFASLAFVPIIFYDEIAQIYGNKKLVVSDVYISMESLKGKDGEDNFNTFSKSLLNDLLFLVQSYSYLPFTRKGTITINGDRRIKVGSFVKLNSTNELFYVTAVTQNYAGGNNLDRTTTITVERGMLMDYIFNPYKNTPVGFTGLNVDLSEAQIDSRGRIQGVKITQEKGTLTSSKPCYFNIIDIEKIRKDIIKTRQNSSATSFGTETYGFNKDVFDFFVKRKMFEENQ